MLYIVLHYAVEIGVDLIVNALAFLGEGVLINGLQHAVGAPPAPLHSVFVRHAEFMHHGCIQVAEIVEPDVRQPMLSEKTFQPAVDRSTAKGDDVLAVILLPGLLDQIQDVCRQPELPGGHVVFGLIPDDVLALDEDLGVPDRQDVAADIAVADATHFRHAHPHPDRQQAWQLDRCAIYRFRAAAERSCDG